MTGLHVWSIQAQPCAAEASQTNRALPPPAPDDVLGYSNRFPLRLPFYLFLVLVNSVPDGLQLIVKWSHKQSFSCCYGLFWIWLLLHCGCAFANDIPLTISAHVTSAMSSPLDPNVTDRKQKKASTDPTDQLATALAAAFQQILQGGGVTATASTGSPSPPEHGVTLASGVGFRMGDRTEAELQETKIKVTRADRQSLQAKPEALKKLRDKVCVALKHVLKEPNWTDILANADKGAVGESVIGTFTQLDAVREWAVANDIAYICNVPRVSDLLDDQAMAQCTEYDNLLTSFNIFSEERVRDYQRTLNLRGFKIDIDGCEWLQTMLEASIEPGLLVRLQQSMNVFPPAERGGLTLFKLLVDKIAKPSFEFVEVGQNFLRTFKLSNFAGEHVPTAVSHYKAVIAALPTASIPPEAVTMFLNGMHECETEKFQELVSSLRGSIYNPLTNLNSTYSVEEQVALFGRTLEDRYTALTTAGAWGGAEKKGSAFQAKIDDGRKYRGYKYPSKEAWFDNQDCDLCKKKHPTWAHDDPVGMRGLSRKEGEMLLEMRKGRSLTSSRPKGRSQHSLGKLKFKSPNHKKQFEKRVHNVLLDTCVAGDDESESEEQVHLAGAVGDDDDENAGAAEDGDDGSDADGSADDAEDNVLSALVAAGLGNLLLKD